MPLASETAAVRTDIAPYLLVSLALHLTVLAAWNLPIPHPFSAGAAGRSFSVALVPTERPDSAADAPMREPAPPLQQSAPAKAAESPEAQSEHPHRMAKRRVKETAQSTSAARQSSESVAAPATHNAHSVGGTAQALPAASSVAAVAAAEAGKDNQVSGTRAEGVSPEAAQHLHTDLREALARHFHYPLTARRKGLEGEVTVSLRIEPGGELTRIRVQQSSGHTVLDEAAVTTLSRVGRLPQAVPWLGGAYFDMTLPVQYRLIGG